MGFSKRLLNHHQSDRHHNTRHGGQGAFGRYSIARRHFVGYCPVAAGSVPKGVLALFGWRDRVDARRFCPQHVDAMQGGTTMEPSSRILIVEDNEMLAALLRRALVREGYDVVVARSGVEMMTLLYPHQPNLIVLDVGLPDTDGRDLLAALKKDPKTRQIPVIVWSGRYADSDRRIALELGAEDFVEKGPPSTLVPKIERVLLRLSERELAKARESLPAKA